MKNDVLIPHLFLTEYRKIVSVLCRHFGFREIEVAEDIASDTFLVAAQAWGIEGPPPNPVGWLYSTAKNKAKNHLHRQAIYAAKVLPEVERSEEPEVEIDLSPENIEDSQLRMMFAVCHPAVSEEAHVGLALRVLCGFGVQEIADAFLTSKDTINKRLTRAREKLRDAGIRIELPPASEMDSRLDSVLTTIYLLFNEGYYSISQNKTIRKDLCLEAIRLCMMLIENPATNKPSVSALMALMCFHASRFEARVDAAGELIFYEEQDTMLWNEDFVVKGGYFLRLATGEAKLSRYHLEAGIAYWHTQKADTMDKWQNILHYYDALLELTYSPMAALNRAYVVSKVRGKQAAIEEAEALALSESQFYHALLGELYTAHDVSKAAGHFEKALHLARTEPDRQAIRRRMQAL